MSYVRSFPPIFDEHARVLILGSMPGKASLAANEYYAHPRNAFWPIVGHLLGVKVAVSYDERCRTLVAHRIALWDVMKACTRTTSLDSDIVESSIEPNDIAGLLNEAKGIRSIFFNGAKAELSFRKYVAPSLVETASGLSCQRLPSTSPAHASKTFSQKLECWRVIIKAVNKT